MLARLKHLDVKLFSGSLRSTARSNAKKALFSNGRWRAYRYRWRRSIVHGINARRWLFLALIAIAYLSGGVISALIPHISWGPKTPGGLEDYYRDLQSLNLTILGIQASFIGLVFPIVIALADSLSSGRIGLSGRISIFLKETEANGTAFSSVMLIIVVLAQVIFLPQWPDRVIAAVTFGNVLWATLNLWLIVRFLTEAIRYLQPQNRRQMINRYVANSALPELLTSMEMRRAFDKLASSLPGDFDTEFTPFDLSGASNSKKVRAGNLLDVIVNDVRPRRLRRAIKQIDSHSKNKRIQTTFRCQFEIAPGQMLRPDGLIATMLPDEAVTKELEQLLIASFDLVDANDEPTDEIEQLLAEYANDLILLLKSGQLGQFETATDEAIDLLVFSLALSEDYAGDADFRKSWFTQRKQWISWMLVFRQLISEVAKRTQDQPAFFEHASYMGYRFQTGLPRTMLSETYVDSLWLCAGLVRELSSHLQKAITDEHLHPETTDKSLLIAVSTYAGSWEAQGRLWADHARRENLSPREAFAGYKAHYERTVTSCFLAAKSGHIDTARWFADQTIKWEDVARDFDRDQKDHLVVSRSAITITDVVTDVDALSAEHSPREDLQVSAAQVFHVGLKNYANDGRTVLLLALLRDLKAEGPPESKLAAVKDLMTGKSIDEGQNSYDEPREQMPADWFAYLIRMELSWEHLTGSYNNLMSELSASLVRENEPPRVSWRGYSGFGSDGVSSFGLEQAELLLASAALTNSNVLNSAKTSELIASISDQVSRDELHNRLLSLALRVGELDIENSIVTMLLPQRSEPEFWRELQAGLQNAISALAEQISARGNDEFARAEFDADKIAKIARWAGSKVMPENSDQFPLSLFRASELVDDGEVGEFHDYTLNMNGLSFGAISNPRLEAEVANEEEFWSNSLRRYLAIPVLRDVYEATEFDELMLETPKALWDIIETFATQNDRATSDYVLAVPGHGSVEWLREWSWKDSARPENVDVSRQPDMPRGYMQHINDVPVFSGFSPNGVLRLVERASFKQIDFFDRGTGPVSITPSRDANDFRKADLALVCSRRVTVDPRPALEIRVTADG